MTLANYIRSRKLKQQLNSNNCHLVFLCFFVQKNLRVDGSLNMYSTVRNKNAVLVNEVQQANKTLMCSLWSICSRCEISWFQILFVVIVDSRMNQFR